MTISKLAKAAGVNVETIRYYERRGLIEQPAKPAQGYRSYPPSALSHIHFIKRAQGLGFTLHEIAQLLQLEQQPCAQVQQLAAEKRRQIHGKIADLQRLEAVLTQLIDQCSLNQDTAHCPIVDTLSQATEES